jgi:hypothetical protein
LTTGDLFGRPFLIPQTFEMLDKQFHALVKEFLVPLAEQFGRLEVIVLDYLPCP